MSLATFKKKSIVAQHGTKVSGKPPGGYWLNQGPFGKDTTVNSVMFINGSKYYGSVGFSLNGGHRNVGYVGQSMAMSKNGTPFRGKYPLGAGGQCGTYCSGNIVYNSAQVITLGDQYKYIKPSVLSDFRLFRNKYRWAYTGVYPNNIVQANGQGNLSDNESQGLYLHKLSVANDCVVDVNGSEKYVDYIKKCGPFGCRTTSARGYKFNVAASNAPYTKLLYQPQTSSQHTMRIQRKCADPSPEQMPIPGPTNGNAAVCAVPLYVNASDVIKPRC